MNISITKMSCFSHRILAASKHWHVHSVYHRTLNLAADNHILSLQAKGSPLSPLSLITGLTASELECLNIRKGDLAAVSGTMLVIESPPERFFFKFTTARKYDLLLPVLPDSEICDALLRNIRAALSLADTGGFEILFNRKPIVEYTRMLDSAQKHIFQSIVFYYEQLPEASAAELSALIGLGIGLTPSGDDFLCGVLAGLRLAGKDTERFACALREKIAAHLDDTIDISATFLAGALDGHYSLAVNFLAGNSGAAPMQSNACIVPSPVDIFKCFSAIGHSSGFDTLCGIFHALMLASHS